MDTKRVAKPRIRNYLCSGLSFIDQRPIRSFTPSADSLNAARYVPLGKYRPRACSIAWGLFILFPRLLVIPVTTGIQ